MAIYTFLNKNTNEEETHLMSISSLDTFKQDNPHLKQLIVSAPGYADPIRVGIGAKPSNQFRDVLKEIKRRNRGSTINTF